MSLKARPATEQDAYLLAPKLRQADLQEIEAAHGTSPLSTLIESYEISSPCFTIVTDDGEVAGMFGVAAGDKEGYKGVVWMLGSDLLKKHSVSFLRQSHAWVERLHKKYPVLWNFVDARNELHIGWLKWIGVQFVGAGPRGVQGRIFREFIHV